MNCLKRGAIIVIEGVDRSGKSTQCKKLVESLEANNIKAKLITFPDRTTLIGGIIDNYLKQKTHLCDEAVHLMFTANRWEKKEEMEKLLNDGITLIVDRYSYSGIVYSSIKKNMNIEWCKKPEQGLIKPDLVFLLTLNENEIENRPNYGNERYENKETQEKVAQAYMKLSKENEGWEIVSAEGSIEDVQTILFYKAVKKIEQVKSTPLQVLTFK